LAFMWKFLRNGREIRNFLSV